MKRPSPISVLRCIAQVVGLVVVASWTVRLYGLLEFRGEDLSVPLLKCGIHCVALMLTIMRACNEAIGGIVVIATGAVVTEGVLQRSQFLFMYPRLIVILGFLWIALGLLEWRKRMPDSDSSLAGTD